MGKKAAETKPEALQGQEPVVLLKGSERFLQQLAIQTIERALIVDVRASVRFFGAIVDRASREGGGRARCASTRPLPERGSCHEGAGGRSKQTERPIQHPLPSAS